MKTNKRIKLRPLGTHGPPLGPMGPPFFLVAPPRPDAQMLMFRGPWKKSVFLIGPGTQIMAVLFVQGHKTFKL